jgi:threonine/homoserine efflux transporter RhtA
MVSCHGFAVATSAIACVFGIWLLWGEKQGKGEYSETEATLLRMSFSYWLVYCVAFGIEHQVLTDWEALKTTLRITTALSYLLTFSCILSLPLHKFAVHPGEE